eukprot:scaffold293443_cov60-Attheya_sp.AAC.1
MSVEEEGDAETEDCWDMRDNGYGQYELCSFPGVTCCGDDKLLQLYCVAELSPLDMVDMYHGRTDPTGYCASWMGAHLFLEAFCVSEESSAPASASLSWLFRQRRVLELGCGTGISGIALLSSSFTRPSHVTFTDADPAALDLCRTNCQLQPWSTSQSSSQSTVDRTEKSNDVSAVDHNGTDSSFAICPLQWGTALGKNIQQQKSDELEENDDMDGSKTNNNHDWLLQSATYETVLATDVLYDIEALKPLLQTASDLLVPETGHFVLSHVPRASISSSSGDDNDDDVVSSREVLEAAICSEAARHDLQWLPHCTIRPQQLMKLHGRTESVVSQNHSLKDMEEAGAAILVFQKTVQSHD